VECSHILLEHKIALRPCFPGRDVLGSGKLADELGLFAKDLEILVDGFESDKAFVGAGFAQHSPATHLVLTFCKSRVGTSAGKSDSPRELQVRRNERR
jgi:hypothetical protein